MKAPRYIIEANRGPGANQIWSYDDLTSAREDIKLELVENPETTMRLYKLIGEYHGKHS